MIPLRTAAAVLLTLTVVCVAACSSSAGIGDWSRTYLRPFDRVFEAALDSLERMDFLLVETDAVRGEIRADSSARRGADTTLVIQVDERASGVSVDVMARGAGVPDGRAPVGLNAAVGEFLRELDARLEGRTGESDSHR
ncbi:MAG: hypothetical protein V2I67_16295 [Thermoanaerobaculales bacterium]|nr:hypothetical protein [Thermoanaerobaculales bacterium]